MKTLAFIFLTGMFSSGAAFADCAQPPNTEFLNRQAITSVENQLAKYGYSEIEVEDLRAPSLGATHQDEVPLWSGNIKASVTTGKSFLGSSNRLHLQIVAVFECIRQTGEFEKLVFNMSDLNGNPVSNP
jgi:hypothetical protein